MSIPINTSLKVNLIRVLASSQQRLLKPGAHGMTRGEGANSMRLLAGFLVVVAVALAAQSVRPQCSMTEMRGVEWVECLIK